MSTKLLWHSSLLWMAALLLTGCNQVASVVVEQLQPTPAATTAQWTTTPIPDEITATPVPTPIGGGESVPIIFVSDRNDEGKSELYQINPDGSGLARLTHDGATKRYPRWSPDAQRVAYVSEVDGLSQVFLLSMSDYQVTQLTDLPDGAADPAWSPDGGSQIAVFQPGSGRNQILIVDSETGLVVGEYAVDLPNLRSLAWAPQGQVIAFSAQANTSETDREVYTLDLQTGLLSNLTNQPGNDDMPAWSRDGSRLLFQSDRDGDFDIFVMQSSGALQTRLTRNRDADIEPHWSADSTLVAFSSDRDGAFHLFTMSDSGGEEQALALSGSNDREPRWSPPERAVIDELVYAGGPTGRSTRNLFLVSISGDQESPLTYTPATDMTPDWSPKGDQLVFSSDRTGQQELFVLNLDGSRGVRQLTDGMESALHPSWSPDGTQIAFEAQIENGDWDVWVINADGSDLRNLTNTSSANDGNPDWSPDGSQLVFSSNREGTFDLYTLSMDESGLVERLTTEPGNEVHPSWSPDGQRIAYRGDSARGNHQLYLVQATGENIRPVFTSGYNDDAPAWSPDGQRIAFASDRISGNAQRRNRHYGIYTYNLRTARLERVTQGDRNARYPTWRPLSSTTVTAPRS
jgi:Tol biopolymer transport system component